MNTIVNYLIEVNVGLILFMIVYLLSPKYNWRTCFITESEMEKPTFSFFNFVFIGKANLLTKSEKEEVILHEWVHVRRIHSLDVLLINILGIFRWFNPFVILYKKVLVQLHEFEADAHSVEKQDIDTYCRLLAKVALESAGFTLVNHFHNSLTLKRITMMKTLRRKIQPWKRIVLMVLVPMIFVVVSCQEQVITDLKTVGENSASSVFIPEEVKAKLETLQKENPRGVYTVVEITEDKNATVEKLKLANDVSLTSSVSVVTTSKNSEGEGRTYFILENGKVANQLSNATLGSDSVFTFVDDQPEYPGGFDSLRSMVARKLKYPSEARMKGIEGKVFIEFIVEKNGKVTHAHIKKGIDTACDQEALRVVAGLNDWMPGKQRGEAVRVRFVMPINFKLGG